MVGVPEYSLPAAAESLKRCVMMAFYGQTNYTYLGTGLYQCSYGTNYSGNLPSSSNRSQRR